MKTAVVACGFLCLFFSAAPVLYAQENQSPVMDENNNGKASTAESLKDPMPEPYGGDSLIDGAPTDEGALRNGGIIEGLSTMHALTGSYSLVPSPEWYSNQYSGSAIDAFKLGDRLWLINRLHYAHYSTTRNDNFPDRLQKLSDSILFGGEWFMAGAAVSSKSNVLFQSFKSVNINAGADFRVWKAGPHSMLVGFLFSSKAEYWGLLIPMPLFTYRYMTPRFLISVGIPLFMVWRPHDDIAVTITGMLPGAGSANVRFKLHRCVALSLIWVHKIEPFYLTYYPYHDIHDIRSVKHQVQKFFNYRDEIDKDKKFMLSSNRAGITFAFNIEGYVTISIFNGIQFWSSYYLTKNIMDLRPDREWIANTYVFEVNARGFLYSLVNSE